MPLRSIDELFSDTRRLAELDRQVVRVLKTSDWDELPSLVLDFRETKLRIKTALANEPALQVYDQEVRAVLDRVLSGPSFPTDRVIDLMEQRAGEPGAIHDPTQDELDAIGDDLLYSWISHYEYAENLFKLNAVIIGVELPDTLQTYLREIRQCFGLQQHNAVVALCRTILEAAARDLCERLGFLEDRGESVVEINTRIFSQLIASVASGRLKQRATSLYYREACPVIHGARTVDSEQALGVVRETLSVVQGLYMRHGF